MGLSSLPQLLLGSKGRADIHGEEEVASGEGGDSHMERGATHHKDSSSQQRLLAVQQRQLQREQLRFRACLGVFR